MIKKISFIVNNKKYLDEVKKSRAILEKDGISTSLWDRTTQNKMLAGVGFSIAGILTIVFTFTISGVSVGIITELGKDIYNQIKKIGKNLIRKNENKLPQECLLLSIDIGSTPNCWYDFYFCTSDFEEILKGTSSIPKIILGFESMRLNLEFIKPSFTWDESFSKWSAIN